MTSPSNSSAEKRALWEVRQRYNVDQSAPRTSSARRVPPRNGTVPPPPGPGRRGPAGKRPRRGGGWLRRVALVVVLCLVLSGGIFGYKILAASNKITATERSILGQLKDLLFVQGKTLGGEPTDRINVMLLAIGGEGHSGQNLADTIMIASFRPSDNAVALLSIPRDLFVQVPGEDYYTKLNAVHAYGESQKKGSGPELMRQKVEEITGQPINYYGRVDFTAFKQIVDAVGGVDVNVENTFFDYWHKISFSAGKETMDGERALAFVRARYIEGPEGGDFKRAARQQQVLLSLRDRVFSVNTALDFGALNSILNSLSDNIRTDMELWELRRFYEMARQINHEAVHSVVLTTGPKGVLVGTTEVLSGVPASVLKTRTGDYAEIRQIASNIFNIEQDHKVAQADETPEAEASPSPSPSPSTTKPSVEIRNGTNTTGLAKKVSDLLTAEGYEVTTIGNAATRDHATTTVYALKQADESGAKQIAEFLEAQADVDLPEGEAESEAEVVVILGQDARVE